MITPVGDVEYHVNLSNKVTVQAKTPQEHITDGIPTCRDQVKGTTHKGDIGHQILVGEF